MAERRAGRGAARAVGARLLLGACAVISCCMPGQKLLALTVRQGAKVVLASRFAVPDSSDVGEMWAAAGGRPFAAELAPEVASRPAASPLEVVVAGPVELVLTHTDSLQSRVTLEGVRLVRADADRAGWRLSAADVARAQQAAAR